MKKENIVIDDFMKIDIRVGLVVEATPVPDSKKLIKLVVNLGEDYGIVTILTGLLAHFPEPTVFSGKKYLFLANLASRKMAGIDSQGMFLAADGADKPNVIEMPEDTPIGAFVH